MTGFKLCDYFRYEICAVTAEDIVYLTNLLLAFCLSVSICFVGRTNSIFGFGFTTLSGTDFTLKKHSNQRGGLVDTVLRVRSASLVKMVNIGHRQERRRVCNISI